MRRDAAVLTTAVFLLAPAALLLPVSAAAATTAVAKSAPADGPRYVPTVPHVYANGGVLSYGDAVPLGAALTGVALTAPVVGIASTIDGHGYWVAGADGAVYALGDAGFYGSFHSAGVAAYAPVADIAGTPDSHGYWLVSQDGGVFAFGDAGFFGSASSFRLAQPVVAFVPLRNGDGYWLVAADGGVFGFGNARYHGSASTLRLAGAVTGAVATPTGFGYWLLAADGSVYGFGDAGFYGSATSMHDQLVAWNAAAVGIARTPDGRGYWVASANGDVFAFGDASSYGSEGGADPSTPVTRLTATPDGHGYWLLDPDGFDYSFADPASPSPFPQARAIVSVADSQVRAVPDTGPFCNPYGPCEAWCSLFSTWIWQRAGIPIPSYPFTGDVYTWSAAHSSVLPASATPYIGDIVMYGESPAQGRSYHTGTVVQTWPNGSIVTIEGDAGPDLEGHYSVVVNGPFLPADPWAYGNYPVYAYAQP